MSSIDNVIIVGSAPSVLEVTPEQVLSTGATVIAVNCAIKWLGAADYWFTLDPHGSNYDLMIEQVEDCQYIMCGPEWFETPPNVKRLTRNEGTEFGWAKAVSGLSEDPTSINTGNSGYGAFGLAYHMKPKKILVLGIDANNAQQVDGHYPGQGNLAHLPELFETAVPQIEAEGIEVVFGSPNSNVACFKRMGAKEGLAWVRK